MATKMCFVVAPIGESGSTTRRRSDRVLKEIITPAVTPLGFEVKRADQLAKPGIITDQVIQHVVDAPLVVADLTNGNPNVFYELAIRHAVQKPTIQLIKKGQRIPFDVRIARTVGVDFRTPKSINNAIGEIGEQIGNALQATETETPVSRGLQRHSGEKILLGWHEHKPLDVLVPPGAKRAVVMGQNLSRRLGLNTAQRRAFAAEVRELLSRGTLVTLVMMSPKALRAIHSEAAHDMARFTLPGLGALALALGQESKKVDVLFHPSATLSLVAVDEAYGYVQPKLQTTERISGRLTVRLGPSLFDGTSLERMLFHGVKAYEGALLVPLNRAASSLRSRLRAAGLLKRSDNALHPTSRTSRPVKSRRRSPTARS